MKLKFSNNIKIDLVLKVSFLNNKIMELLCLRKELLKIIHKILLNNGEKLTENL